jgi:hypothetical protein
MWLLAEYEATSLFSLKPANATSSGGRTLLVPTPYAIKMALLDVACKVEGVAVAEAACHWLASARVALRPPRRVVVNNTFIKVLRPRRNPAKEGSADMGYFQRTISYREYAQLEDSFGIAIQVPTVEAANQLQNWLIGINYLGKRGSFVQIQAIPERSDNLPAEFIAIGEPLSNFSFDALLTQLDDTGADIPFEKFNVYVKSSFRLGRERILHHVALPYRLMRSSRSYSYYEILP